MIHDEQWHEHQYMPSLAIAEAGQILRDWKDRSAATRSRLKFVSDIRYGMHPREVFDFYPASNPWGCVVFIHGGYWVEFSKFETSFIAEGFVDQGLSVALINYPLCPEVSLQDIRKSCARAFAHLHKSVLSVAERAALVVTGHSAGGYLAAAHLVEDWEKLDLPQNPVSGVMALSGVFDVTPLLHTSLKKDLRLDATGTKALDLNLKQPLSHARLVLAVGQHESLEFHRQSKALGSSWNMLKPEILDISGDNHFTILDSLADPAGQLNQLAVALARR